MRKVTNNQRGIAHLGLLIVAVFVFGAVGLAGVNIYKNNQSAQLSSAPNDTHVLGTKDDKKSSIKRTKTAKTSPSGTVQYVVTELVVDITGKKTYVPRGNVSVNLTATNDKQRCRDAGKAYIRDGKEVFAGQTDADKDHKKNLGKIKIDACTIGVYTASLTLSDKYVAVGDVSKKVNVRKKINKVSFVIKKTTPSTADDAKSQDDSPKPKPAPKPSATAPITAAQEKIALDQTRKFEDDMFFSFSKWCKLPTDDLGEVADKRKADFAANSKAYMAPALIAQVNSKHGGDAFPLLGVSELKCFQYNLINLQESKALVSSGDGQSAVVEHSFKATARPQPSGDLPATSDLSQTWVYHLSRSGDVWLISSIDVK